MTQLETQPPQAPTGQVSDLPEDRFPSAPAPFQPWSPAEVGTGPAPEPAEGEPEEPGPPAAALSQARSLLTELVPAGMGEVLVTDVWARPEPKQANQPKQLSPVPSSPAGQAWKGVSPDEAPLDSAWGGPPRPHKGEPEPVEGPPPDSQRSWEQRQELRDLGLLRERPLVSYDARVEQYWTRVRQARGQATQALVDPYTELVIAFADVNTEEMSELRRSARDYGWEAGSLLRLGRSYVAIGKLKGARQVFKAATKAEPYYPDAWWHLGVAHLLSRAHGEAAAALEQAVDQSAGDFRAEMALGLARYHLKDYPAAEEHLRRQAGNDGARAAVRSLLACSLRMQEKWDDARVELAFLRQSRAGDWPLVAAQCLDCVERGEQKRHGPLRARRRTRQILKAVLAAAGGGIWAAYARAEDLFRQQAPWAALPLFLAALVLARGLRGLSGRELPGEFGNAEQGIPCWQATTWMRPRRSEF